MLKKSEKKKLSAYEIIQTVSISYGPLTVKTDEINCDKHRFLSLNDEYLYI